MFGGFEALRKLTAGQALPNLAHTSDGALPVFIGAVAEEPEAHVPLDYTVFMSCDLDGDGHGPSLRVAIRLQERAPALFGSLTSGGPAATAVALRTWQVVGWLNPADEEHLLWVNHALRAGAFGVELLAAQALAGADWAVDQGRACQRLWLKNGLDETLASNFNRGMEAACAMPWAALDFAAACRSHAARHPLGA